MTSDLSILLRIPLMLFVALSIGYAATPVSNDGWTREFKIADEKGNMPGLIIPGKPELSMKDYQELAPDIAMD